MITRQMGKLHYLYLGCPQQTASLLHSAIDLDLETSIDPEIKNWLAFAKQKLTEVNEIAGLLKAMRLYWGQ